MPGEEVEMKCVCGGGGYEWGLASSGVNRYMNAILNDKNDECS